MTEGEMKRWRRGVYGHGDLELTPWLWPEAAEVMGLERLRIDKELGRTSEFRGDGQEHPNGVFGEIVLRQWCLDVGLPFEADPLVIRGDRSLPYGDLAINGWSVDVKVTGADTGKVRCRLFVNQNLYNRRKRKGEVCDFYVCVKRLDDRQYCIGGYATGEEIGEAPLYDWRPPVYGIMMADLHKLERSVFELPKGG